MWEEDRVELGGNWIVATITEEVATKQLRVETIPREVAIMRARVATIPYPYKSVKILISQPNAFAKSCVFCGKKIEWELGGNWIVATITEEVATKRPRVASKSKKVATIPYPHKVLKS